MRFYRRLPYITTEQFKNIYSSTLHNCHYTTGRVYEDTVDETELDYIHKNSYGKYYNYRFKVE